MAPRTLVAQSEGRAVLYVRVSQLAGRGGEDFHSPDLQIGAMRRAVVAAGLREVAVIDDIDVSGRTFSRDGLTRLRRMVEDKELDVVAVHDLSRLGRNAGEALRFVAWLKEHGVGIISTVEQITDTPEGNFMVAQFLGMAQLYSDQMGRRWSDVIARRATEQGLTHGRPPLGYVKCGRGLDVDPVVGPAVTATFANYAAGHTVGDLARNLGLARGATTNRLRVKRVLENPVYLGKVKVRGEWADGKHEPLVDAATWQAVRRRADEDSRTPPRIVNASYSLTGLMYCAHCGRRAAVWPQRRNGEPTPRVWCRQKIEATYGCDGIGVPLLTAIEDMVFVQVLESIHLLKADPADIAAWRGNRSTTAAGLTQMEHQLEKVQKAIGRIAREWGTEQMSDAAYKEAVKPLKATEADLIARIGAAKLTPSEPAMAEFAGVAETLEALWPMLDGNGRNRILKQVVSAVVIRRGLHRHEPVGDRVRILLRDNPKDQDR